MTSTSFRRAAVFFFALALSAVSSCGHSGSPSDTTVTGSSDDPNTAGSYDSSALLYDQLPSRYQSQPITVAMDPNFGGLNSYKPGTTVFQGVNVDLAKALSEPLGTRIEIVAAPFDQILIGLTTHRYSTSMSGMTDTAERETQVDFVDYFKPKQVFFVEKGNPKGVSGGTAGACGIKISVVRGTPDEKVFSKVQQQCHLAGKEAPEQVHIESIAASRLALESGRVDAVIRENSSAPSFRFADVVDLEFGETTYLGAIFAKNDTQLRDVVLEAFKELMKSGEYTRILETNGYEAVGLDSPGINLATQGPETNR